MTAPAFSDPAVTGSYDRMMPASVKATYIPGTTTYTFAGQFGMGRDGENAVFELLRRRGHLVRPYDDSEHSRIDRDAQRRGIDAQVYFHHPDPEKDFRSEGSVEIKTDSYRSNAIAIELQQVRSDGTTRPGCALTSEADYWLYCRVAVAQVLVLRGRPFRRYAATLRATHDVRNIDPRTGQRYGVRIALVTVDQLRAAGVLQETIPLPDDLAQSLARYARRQ